MTRLIFAEFNQLLQPGKLIIKHMGKGRSLFYLILLLLIAVSPVATFVLHNLWISLLLVLLLPYFALLNKEIDRVVSKEFGFKRTDKLSNIQNFLYMKMELLVPILKQRNVYEKDKIKAIIDAAVKDSETYKKSDRVFKISAVIIFTLLLPYTFLFLKPLLDTAKGSTEIFYVYVGGLTILTMLVAIVVGIRPTLRLLLDNKYFDYLDFIEVLRAINLVKLK